jgi:hypothetical protein
MSLVNEEGVVVSTERASHDPLPSIQTKPKPGVHVVRLGSAPELRGTRYHPHPW